MALNILYMRAAAGAVDPGDTDITDYLGTTLGHTITEIADNASVPGDIGDYDILIIGATVAGSSAPGGTFSTVAIPVLSLNAFPLDEMDIVGIHTDQASQTQMYVLDYTHPVFTEAGIGANGTVTITSVSMTQTANYASFGPDHVSLAAYGTESSNGVLIGLYESGDTMNSSHVAEARRIYFTVREMVTTGDYNSTWYDVLRGAVYWAAAYSGTPEVAATMNGGGSISATASTHLVSATMNGGGNISASATQQSSQILRPASTIAAGTWDTGPTTGQSLHGYTSDDSDTTYIEDTTA